MIYRGRRDRFFVEKACAGCYLEYEDKILFLQKRQCNTHYPNLWGVPAGKIEDGESPLEAVRREVFEETGIILPKAPFFLKRYFVSHPHLNFSYDAFRLTLDGHFSVRPDVLICDEHQAFGWFTLYDLLEKELIPDEFAVLCASPIFSRL